MHQLTRISLKHPRITSLCLLAVTLLLAAGLPRLRTEFGYRVLLGDDHPSIETLDAFIERYGGGLPLQIAWECGPGHPCETVFDRPSLLMADALTKQLAPLEGVQSVYGPANAPLLVPAPGGFAVRRLVEDGHPRPDAQSLLPRAVNDPLWLHTLVSADGRVGAIMVQPSDTLDRTNVRIVDALTEVLAPFQESGFDFHLVGDPVVNVLVGRELSRSTARLIPFTILVITLILSVLSRSWKSTFTTLLTMGVALVWTFGLLGWLQWPQDGVLEVLAPVILIVGVCDSVHFLASWMTPTQLPSASQHQRLPSIVDAARDVGPPCLITTVTTAAAFLSFATSELDTFVRFGVISAFGVSVCLLLTFTLLPLLNAALPRIYSSETSGFRRWLIALDGIVRTAQRRAVPIIVAVSVLALFGLIGWIVHLRVDTNWYEAFGEQSQVMRWVRFVEARLRPSASLEVEISLPPGTALEDPAVTYLVEDFSEFLSGIDGLGPSSSVLDILARLNRLLHDDDVSYERPAATPAQNAELLELIAFEAQDTLDRWISLDRSILRLSVPGHFESSTRRGEILALIRTYAEEDLPADWVVNLTGQFAMGHDWVEALRSTQIRSFPTAFALVLVLVAVFLRSLPLGLAAMVPALVPVVLTLGAMGWTGMTLDVGRAMIAAVVIGIAVDDSIHLLTQYKRERARGQAPDAAMRGAVLHVGRAIVTTSLALALGFLTLMASAWQTIASFGFFVALAILGALAATLFVLPALVFVITGSRSHEPCEVSPPLRPPSGVRRGLLSLLAIAPVAMALVVAASEAVRFETTKELGCWVLPNARVALLQRPTVACPLWPHERIEAIQSRGSAAATIGRPEELRAALVGARAPVAVAVSRGGATSWHEVALREVSPLDHWLRLLLAALLSAFLLCLPLVLLTRSPASAAEPFALLYAALATVLVLFITGQDSIWLNRIALVAAVFAPATLADLSFTFPRPRELLRESPRVRLIPYGLSAVLLPAAWLAMEHDTVLWPTVVYLLLALSLGAWLVMLGSCYFAIRESTSIRERSRARLLLYGTLLLPVITAPVLFQYTSDEPASLTIFFAVSIVLLPIPIGLAISRYNLFDLEQDLRSGVTRLVYYTSGAALAAATFGIGLSLAGVEWSASGPLVLFALSLVCIAGVDVLRDRLVGWAEEVLSPNTRRLQRLRARFVQQLAELHDAQHVARVLGETLCTAVRPRGACIFLQTDGAWAPAYVLGESAPSRLDLAHAAIHYVGPRRLMQLADLADDPGDPRATLLHQSGVEAAVPLRRGSESLGLVLLSPSTRGSPYTSSDLDFVALAGDHAALALHNARVAAALAARERQAATGRTALALAHDVSKDLGLIRSLARRLPKRLRDARRAARDLASIQELAEELEESLRRFVRDGLSPNPPDRGSLRLDEVVARAVRGATRVHGVGRINQSIDPAARGVHVHENFERVLLNLFDNALMASNATEPIHLFATIENGSLHAAVIDRGCGMTSGQRSNAFQLGFTTRPEKGGSGVGLAISREILESLGGSIEVQPNPGGGTVARVRLPAAR